jgi:hypothetical protein
VYLIAVREDDKVEVGREAGHIAAQDNVVVLLPHIDPDPLFLRDSIRKGRRKTIEVDAERQLQVQQRHSRKRRRRAHLKEIQ